MKLNEIYARPILNSKGKWTVEVHVRLEDGSMAFASVPEGISTGATEAKYVTVEESVKIVKDEFSRKLKNADVSDLDLLDQKLIDIDNTNDKSRIGANTMLATSIACARAFSVSQNIELYEYLNRFIPVNLKKTLPELFVLVFEGGAHGDTRMQIQEFLAVVPTLEKGLSVYQNVTKEVRQNGFSTNLGAEGALSPENFSAHEAVKYMKKFNEDIALDVAASSVVEATKEYELLAKDYDFFSVEDPYSENEWEKWSEFLLKNPKQMVVADDIVTTNSELIRKGVEEKIANAVIIKPNQIGTITEAIRAVNVARNAGWKIVCSHRGGETNDDFIADFAVAVVSDYVKFGGFSRGERIAKYNRLFQIRDKISKL